MLWSSRKFEYFESAWKSSCCNAKLLSPNVMLQSNTDWALQMFYTKFLYY